jgi:hypothetical protein
MRKLISFDIDGTLEVGDPPGIVTIDVVRRAKDLGWLIGSCSDHTIASQRDIWERHDIRVHFTVLKHQLAMVRDQFEAEAYFHVGDTDIDRYFAVGAGFEFIPVAEVSEPWLLDLIDQRLRGANIPSESE